MKNIVSTILIFVGATALIIGGAYIFQSLNGMGSINRIDNIVHNLSGVMETRDNNSDYILDNFSISTLLDNITLKNVFQEKGLKLDVETLTKMLDDPEIKALLSENGFYGDNNTEKILQK